MPDVSEDKQVATAYPPNELYESWVDHAEDLDMSISQYLIRMVEAGRKQVDMESVATESLHELQSRTSELQAELQHQRKRNRELERQLEFTAYTEVAEFIEANPGAETAEIIQHVADTVPGRVAAHLDLLEGDGFVERDGRYYPTSDETENEESSSEASTGNAGDGE